MMNSGKQFFIFYSLLVLSTLSVFSGSEFEFQALFTRIPQNYINAFPLKVLENATVENCARSCVREVEFECKSFDIDNIQRECHLHNHSHTERLIGLQESLTMDHYRSKSSSNKTFQKSECCLSKWYYYHTRNQETKASENSS